MSRREWQRNGFLMFSLHFWTFHCHLQSLFITNSYFFHPVHFLPFYLLYITLPFRPFHYSTFPWWRRWLYCHLRKEVNWNWILLVTICWVVGKLNELFFVFIQVPHLKKGYSTELLGRKINIGQMSRKVVGHHNSVV